MFFFQLHQTRRAPRNYFKRIREHFHKYSTKVPQTIWSLTVVHTIQWKPFWTTHRVDVINIDGRVGYESVSLIIEKFFNHEAQPRNGESRRNLFKHLKMTK